MQKWGKNGRSLEELKIIAKERETYFLKRSILKKQSCTDYKRSYNLERNKWKNINILSKTAKFLKSFLKKRYRNYKIKSYLLKRVSKLKEFSSKLAFV